MDYRVSQDLIGGGVTISQVDRAQQIALQNEAERFGERLHAADARLGPVLLAMAKQRPTFDSWGIFLRFWGTIGEFFGGIGCMALSLISVSVTVAFCVRYGIDLVEKAREFLAGIPGLGWMAKTSEKDHEKNFFSSNADVLNTAVLTAVGGPLGFAFSKIGTAIVGSAGSSGFANPVQGPPAPPSLSSAVGGAVGLPLRVAGASVSGAGAGLSLAGQAASAIGSSLISKITNFFSNRGDDEFTDEEIEAWASSVGATPDQIRDLIAGN